LTWPEDLFRRTLKPKQTLLGQAAAGLWQLESAKASASGTISLLWELAVVRDRRVRLPSRPPSLLTGLLQVGVLSAALMRPVLQPLGPKENSG